MFSSRSIFRVVPVLAVAFLSVAPSYASVVQTVQETFQSGAVFSGSLTFTDDFSNVTAVDGWLTGGVYGVDHINWIFDTVSTTYAASFGGQFRENFLMNGTPGSYTNFIEFTWDFSSAPNLVIATPAADALNYYGGNNVGFVDPLVGGPGSIGSMSIGPIPIGFPGPIPIDPIPSGVPEPSTLGLLGAGLIGVGLFRRRQAAS
jgi:PEP-CTERM motif